MRSRHRLAFLHGLPFARGGRNLAIQGCTPKGMPLIMEQPYPIEFRRDDDDIALHLEEYDTERTIHMGREEPPAGTDPSPLGYSIGRWEGETLIVTTTRLNWPWLTQGGVPQSQDATLSERFTPAADGSRLTYELTVTDPVNFTEPVTRGKQWLYLLEINPGMDKWRLDSHGMNALPNTAVKSTLGFSAD